MRQRNHRSHRSGRPAPGARQQRGVREQAWTGTFMVVGMFFGIFCAAFILPRTLVPPMVVVRTLAFCCAFGLLLPYVASGLRLGMAKGEWVFFNVVGVGPALTGVLLLANLYVHDEPMCAITSVRTQPELIVTTAAGEYPWRPQVGGMLGVSGRTEATTHYRICVAKGVLGYWSIVDLSALPPAEWNTP